MSRTSIAVFAALAVAAAVGLITLSNREPGLQDSPVSELQAGAVVAPPASLPDFSLRDQRNRSFTAASLDGRWSLVFPGFTHCPDICPTTLSTLDRVHGMLGDGASGLQVVLLSVDPERDTPEVLARYLDFFNPGFVGVTGERDQLQRLYDGLGVQHIRIPGAAGEYSVDHSAALLLINPEGRLAGYFMPPFHAGRLAADLGPLLATAYHR